MIETTDELEGRHTGQRLWFEYHCLESHGSEDARLWYRSHQRVTVSSPMQYDGVDASPEWLREVPTQQSRVENGCPGYYLIRFDDGFHYTALEDELLDTPAQYERPDPPEGPPCKR